MCKTDDSGDFNLLSNIKRKKMLVRKKADLDYN